MRAWDRVPASEIPKAIFSARVHMVIYGVTVLAVIWMRSFLLIGRPRIYGCWHMSMTELIQHGGLADDVVDHRLNSRTCLMNTLSRWIYWNMNCHVEYHIFPMVPYYALPWLHPLIKDDLPAPCPNIWAAFTELVPAILRQRHEKGYYLRKDLLATARAYRKEFHREVPDRSSIEA